MTYAYFAPKDLRAVDPRPEPSMDDAEDAVRDLLISRLEGEELNRALQALGMDSYERANNTKGRDAWTRSTVTRTPRDAPYCLHAHLRARYGRQVKTGQWRCRECQRLASVRKRAS